MHPLANIKCARQAHSVRIALAFALLRHAASLATMSSSCPQLKGLLDRVKHNDRAGEAARSALPFVIGNENKAMGLVLPRMAKEFSRFPSVFSVTNDEVRLIDQSEWLINDSPDYSNNYLLSHRSEAVRDVLESMKTKDVVPALRGWRNEPFAVRESFHSSPELIVERAAAVLFGVPAYGVFVNGYTCEDTSNCCRPTHVWVGKRSMMKQTWPNRLDSLAAGGLAAGVLPRQAILSECTEEAGIDESYLQERIRAVSAVSYTGFNDDMWGLKRDVLFCFDLELPLNFEPEPVDGEMESFQKIPIDSLLEMLASPILKADDSDNLWKPNVGVVLIDFLVRHGILDSDDPYFLELIDALRGARCA
uniref:Nudix hydrolase domain-containing protein n=1 Tax=Ditylum brightwellii TaxID=49249 RepID=A0A7S4RAB1_9STRA|mmetsp:Transcript_38034/g.57894  ORF Transcript_38034/g.57894 Transcript_38034/m.57894 type:complete len:363 (+) Transcript_38034:146-1234(+)